MFKPLIWKKKCASVHCKCFCMHNNISVRCVFLLTYLLLCQAMFSLLFVCFSWKLIGSAQAFYSRPLAGQLSFGTFYFLLLHSLYHIASFITPVYPCLMAHSFSPHRVISLKFTWRLSPDQHHRCQRTALTSSLYFLFITVCKKNKGCKCSREMSKI